MLVVELRPVVFFAIQEWEDELHVVLDQIIAEHGRVVRRPTAGESVDILFAIYHVVDHDAVLSGDALPTLLDEFEPPAPRVCIYGCGRAASGQGPIGDEDVRQLAVAQASRPGSMVLTARATRPAGFGDFARQEIYRELKRRSYGDEIGQEHVSIPSAPDPDFGAL